MPNIAGDSNQVFVCQPPRHSADAAHVAPQDVFRRLPSSKSGYGRLQNRRGGAEIELEEDGDDWEEGADENEGEDDAAAEEDQAAAVEGAPTMMIFRVLFRRVQRGIAAIAVRVAAIA